MQVWKYHDKYFTRTNDKTVVEYRVDLSNEIPEGKTEVFSFTKCMPYIMDLIYYIYGFEKQRTH